MDKELIGRIVEREIESRMSWEKFAALSGVSRATLYRVKEADPRITQSTLRKIERGLGLPFDTLSSVGVHDWPTLRRDGLNEELIEWLMREASSSASHAPPTSKRRSTRATAPGYGKD